MQTMLEAIKAKITLICASVVFITLMGANLSISQETTETEEIILPDPIEILDDSLFVQSSSDLNSKGSQAVVSDLSDETQDLLGQYRLVLQQIDRLIAYNNYVEQLDQFALIERGIVPLMLDSIDTLDKFIDLDVPFLLEERKARVARLRTIMNLSDVTVSEKYRQIMDAYQIETTYGRDIEAYTGLLEIGGVSRQVDFLRIGRTSLTYQTPDQEETGFWNKQDKQWEKLPNKYQNYVTQGLRVARKQVTPNLLELPIEAPGEGR